MNTEYYDFCLREIQKIDEQKKELEIINYNQMLRDKFAIVALECLIKIYENSCEERKLAERSYTYADEMMKARVCK